MNYKIRSIYTLDCIYDQTYASTIKTCSIKKGHLTFMESRDKAWTGRHVSVKENREIWNLCLDAITLARSDTNIFSLSTIGTIRSYEALGKINSGTAPVWETNLSKVFKSMCFDISNSTFKVDQEDNSMYVEIHAKSRNERHRYAYLFSLDLNGEIKWFTFLGEDIGDTKIEWTKTSILLSYCWNGKTIFGISKLTGKIEWMYSTCTGYEHTTLYPDLNLLYITPMDTYRCIAEIDTNTGEVLNNYFIHTADRPGLTFLHRRIDNGLINISVLASAVGRYASPLNNSALMLYNNTGAKRLITARTNAVEIGYPFTSTYSSVASDSMFLIDNLCVKYSVDKDKILCRYIDLTSGKSKTSNIPLSRCNLSAIFPVHNSDKHIVLLDIRPLATIGIIGPDCIKKIPVERVNAASHSVRIRLFKNYLCFLGPTCCVYDLEEIC